MDVDAVELADTLPSGQGCLPHYDRTPCFNSLDSCSAQHNGEEDIMMCHALEGLPCPSPFRSSEWGRRSDGPSHLRLQDEQDLVDAISKRTRAHYSLADMSLDQLETFLQESDEEDYFQNVDDEEEYRKFLAAVQEKVGAEEDDKMGKVIEESESEDEDADFEVEIEEALESDTEEGLDGIGRKRKRSRRPVIREKGRKIESLQIKLLRAGRAKAPFKPLLPYSGNVSVEGSRFLVGSTSRTWMCSVKRQPSCCGFTAHQVGQLYCLMHEHVQLLLQVYVMCILEPAMQQAALDTHRMLMELVKKREAVLSWKRSAFPDFCFRPPYIHPSVPENEVSFQILSSESPEVVKSRDGASSTCTGSHQFGVLSRSLHSQFCEVVGSPTQVNNAGTASAHTICASVQTKSIDNTSGSELAYSSSSAVLDAVPLEWVPATIGPVRSLLDVAPLALVREFTEVVDQIVEASKRQHFSSGGLTPELSRAPLFAVRFQVSQISKSAFERVKAHSSPDTMNTMTALVESIKEQPIALVPKGIAAAMVRFSPLFNKSLFPHRAPSSTAAKRLLFTASEDELLAMGLMIYNNDWKAIQERFLPSKSLHQIFVRQKNRSSARAPHNSIKAVRRMKSSPLTADEIACIEEALKVYKYDWTKVCQHCVPHRDPAILPRQLRVAVGTQNSYKRSLDCKEKRRLHDARRCQGFAATSQIFPSMGTVHSKLHEAVSCCDERCGLEKSQFHDGFLGHLCTSLPTRHLSSETPLNSVRSSATIPFRQAVNGRKADAPGSCSDTFSTRLKSSKRANSKVCSCPPTYISLLRGNQTVKLSPGLPSLKLPPTVRVLSQSDCTSGIS